MSIGKRKNFIIHIDHLDGLKMSEEEVKECKAKGFTKNFKLYDDDDILYYSGYLHEDIEGEDEFIPLDWGMMDSGCTRLDYRNPDGTYSTI
jgi:hypothetical protein